VTEGATLTLPRRRLLQTTAVGGGLAVSPGVALAGAARQAQPVRPPAAYDPDGQYAVDVEDVEYRRAGDEAWLARVYRPRGPGPFPALLDVHAGGWTILDRTFQASLDQTLAASGLVVVAVDFRQGAAHPYPSSLQDINYAVRWLTAHAPAFAADARVLGAVGVSSGAHLALLSAMRPNDPRYAALPLPAAPAGAALAYVLADSPVVDTYGRYLYAREAGRADLAGAHEAFFGSLEAMDEASPQRILERGERARLVPMLHLQGTADANVPLAMGVRFAAAYRAAGGPIEFVAFPDAPHGFSLVPGPDAGRAIRLMRAFVARQLSGTGPRRLPRTGDPDDRGWPDPA
jgi:acetyl esterase/lipase